MLRLGILGSTRGTVLSSLITAIQKDRLAAEIAVVLSNKAEALILEKAKKAGLSTQWLDPKNLTAIEYDQQISSVLQAHHVELIVLIGYMRIISPQFLTAWHHRIINIHPSLLPAFAGGMDKNVHQAVLKAKVKESGCTVHYVTEEVDKGPILLQKKCPVFAEDTVETLKTRVQQLEGEALIEVISSYKFPHFNSDAPSFSLFSVIENKKKHKLPEKNRA
ncbi:MAG: purN [Gammaproteobacteria bacterium]|jgi:phosphoribosylglycinamide formyltransferase-1|nr:purN [Gammaproteobacteria bacterium]